jgi:Lrp/AsnC family leucine-responsive transcriptional regulator
MVFRKPKSGQTPTKPPATAKPLPGRVAQPAAGPAPADGALPPAAPERSEPLDRYDIAILAALQQEARLSNAELANRIGLSPAPTWRRVRRLEQQGIIRGYRAEIDRPKIGLGVLAFVRVDAERNTGSSTKPLEDAIRALPEVIACHYISGAGTFELTVVATDLEAFSKLARERLLNLPNVKDFHTSFSLGEVKAAAALPLAHLGLGEGPR